MTPIPILTRLRQVNGKQAALAEAAEHAMSQAMEVGWGDVIEGREYLSFNAVGDSGVTPLLVDLRSWIDVHVPELAHMSLSALDTDSLRQLVTGTEQIVTGREKPIPFASYEFTNLYRPSSRMRMPTIDTLEGPVFLAGPWHGVAAESHTSLLPMALSLDVDYRLGRVSVRHRLVERMAVGDVLLFRSGPFVALCGKQVVFSFSIHSEGLIVEQIVNGTDISDFDDAEIQERLDVGGLEVTIDVVLRRDRISLGDLGRLVRGSTLPLAENAWQSVQLRVGNQLYAVGELVDTGSGLGVQVARILAR